jgi:glycosyltransferase involved in cell wall biosynthesis
VRILHVVPYYEDAWAYGGIPRLASALARGLARRGHQVTVCTTDVADEDSRVRVRQDYEGVSVRVFRNLSNRLAYHYQFFTPVGLSRFLRRCASEFDVAHLHACHHLPGAVAAAALRRARVPYLLSPNGTALRIERRRLAKLAFDLTIGRRVVPDAARVLAVSRAEHRQLQSAGIPAARVRLVPNPIDEQEFAIAPDLRTFRTSHALGDGPLILYLGKLTPRKGVDVLVHAFARMNDTSARLVVAGNDMGSGATIAAIARDAGLGHRFVRVGLLRGRERLAALAAADVVVYPSRDEVFGLVPVEALLCGTPVVVSSDSGCGEVIGQLGGGHIVPFGDAATLASAVTAIMRDPVVWRARARAAGVRARQRFGSDVVCARLEEVYREVAQGSAA